MLVLVIFGLLYKPEAPQRFLNRAEASKPKAIAKPIADAGAVPQEPVARVKTEAEASAGKLREVPKPIAAERPSGHPREVQAVVPTRVFCGSPEQRNWKQIVVANAVHGKKLAESRGWTGSEWKALLELWSCESSWNHAAINPQSGAGGIPQSWPASKMATKGSDWESNPITQISWGLDYIARTYTKPSVALEKHYRSNWY